jgi:hypothetical protein
MEIMVSIPLESIVGPFATLRKNMHPGNILLLLAGAAFAQEDGLHWHDNYPSALAEAKRTQKPIFLEFRCEP